MRGATVGAGVEAIGVVVRDALVAGIETSGVVGAAAPGTTGGSISNELGSELGMQATP